METDKQFVERQWNWLSDNKRNDDHWKRLFGLALRGAETQWKPIEEAPKVTSKKKIEMIVRDSRGWSHVVFWGTGYCRDRPDTEVEQWRIAWDNEPIDDFTHFIPLTALGEPKP